MQKEAQKVRSTFQKVEMYLLTAILFIAGLLRTIWINSVPPAVNYDQLYYLINAKSFFLTGKDISQTISLLDILLFKYPPNDLVQAELPFFLSFLTVGPFPYSLVLSALPNIVLSILTVLLVYLIARHLFNTKVALLSAAVAAFNPWFIFIGRTLYEVVPATFFFLLGFYILLIAKNWKILLAFPVFLLAFYSYIGTKIIFLPLVIIFITYCYLVVNNKKYLKYYLGLLGLCVAVVLFFYLQISATSDASRLSEIITPMHPKIAAQVDVSRRLTIDSPLVSIVENKFTAYAGTVTRLLLESISPVYLFLEGDYFFALGNHGLFYSIDIIFILIGAGLLLKQNRRLFFLFLSVFLVALIPQIIHDVSGKGGNFTPHISLIFPVLIMLIGYGIIGITSIFKIKNTSVYYSVIGIIYAILLTNFAVHYFYQLPYKSGLFDFPNRHLSRYLVLAKSDSNAITIYSNETKRLFKNYLFYSNVYNRETVTQINERFMSQNYSFETITFMPCEKFPKAPPKNEVIIIAGDCDIEYDKASSINIPFLKDGGAVYKIYNDSLCKNIKLHRYVSNLTLESFSLEKLDKKDFCTTFITDYGGI